MAGALTRITEVEVSGCGQIQATDHTREMSKSSKRAVSHGGAGGLTGTVTIQLPLPSRSFSLDVGWSICACSLGLDRYACTTKVWLPLARGMPSCRSGVVSSGTWREGGSILLVGNTGCGRTALSLGLFSTLNVANT